MKRYILRGHTLPPLAAPKEHVWCTCIEECAERGGCRPFTRGCSGFEENMQHAGYVWCEGNDSGFSFDEEGNDIFVEYSSGGWWKK